MFDSEHGRPFVFGMNGTFSGTFIPQVIALDATPFVQTLPELVAPPEGSSAPELTRFSASRFELGVDNFIIAPTAQHAAPSAQVSPGFAHFAPAFSAQSVMLPNSEAPVADFGWDAPALPVSDLHQWDMPVMSSWFDPQPLDGVGWDFFLY